jgi:hypothetical protein
MNRPRLERIANRSANLGDKSLYETQQADSANSSRRSSISIDDDKTYGFTAVSLAVEDFTDSLIDDINILIEELKQEHTDQMHNIKEDDQSQVKKAEAEKTEQAQEAEGTEQAQEAEGTEEAEAAEAEKIAFIKIVKVAAEIPKTYLQASLELLPQSTEIRTSGRDLSLGLANLRKAQKRLIEKLEIFFTGEKGKIFLDAVTSFMNAVKDFFTKIMPGIASEVWSKVEKKIRVPLQENVKLAISHLEEKIGIKTAYKEYRNQVLDESARKKIEAVSKGVVDSREGRKKFSKKTRKEGLKGALDYRKEEALANELECIGSKLDNLRAISKTVYLDKEDIEFLRDIGINTIDKGDITENSMKILLKKIDELQEKHTAISQTIDNVEQIKEFLSKKDVNERAVSIFEKRYVKNRGSGSAAIY